MFVSSVLVEETRSTELSALTLETSPGLRSVSLPLFSFRISIILFPETTRKTRIVDTMYNATNNELVRTKTLVKGAIISVDAAPFRQWYEAHYALPLARKKNAKISEEDSAILNKKRSNTTQKKYTERQKTAAVDALLIEQFNTGRLLGKLPAFPSAKLITIVPIFQLASLLPQDKSDRPTDTSSKERNSISTFARFVPRRPSKCLFRILFLVLLHKT